MTENDIFDRIERYLDNELSASEREKFEEEVSSNKTLGDALKKQVLVRQLAWKEAKNDYKKTFDSWHDEGEQIQSRKIIRMRRNVLAAAAVIIVLVISALALRTLFVPQVFTPQELYAANTSLLPAPSNFRGNDSNMVISAEMHSYWERGVNYYEDSSFEQANREIETFLSLIPSDVEASQYHLYLGISYLFSDEYEEALTHFEQINLLGIHRNDAQWYLALTYLKMNEIQALKQALNTIISTPGQIYGKKAEELLEQVERLEVE